MVGASPEDMRLLVPVVAVCVGCSSSSSGPPPDPVAVVGSYELTLSAPHASSDGLHARLDLEREAGALSAVITFDGHPLEVVPVTASGSTLKLTPVSVLTVRVGAGRPVDHWSAITISLDAAGIPRTSTWVGVSDGLSGDSPTRVELQGTAAIVPDVTAPKLTLGLGVTREKLLPWEPVTLVASEPVRVSDVAALASVSIGASTFALAPPPDPPSHAGENTSFRTPSGFLPSGPGSVTTGAIADRTKNASKPATLPFEVLDVGPAATTFDFDAVESSQLGTWGAVSHAAGSDCHTGDCIQLGRWASLACGDSAGPGLARRVSGSVGSLSFSVRAKLDTTYAPTFALGLPASALAVDVVTDAGVSTVYVQRTAVTDTWSTVTIPAVGARAFAIRGAVDASCGPYPVASWWTVWIDDVVAK